VLVQNLNDAPLVFFLPKSTDTIIPVHFHVVVILLQNWNGAPLVFFLPKSTDTIIPIHCHVVVTLLQNWNDAPLVFFLPKSTDTTITELCIENMVRPSVFATAVVPLEDMKKYSGGKGGTGVLCNMLCFVITCHVTVHSRAVHREHGAAQRVCDSSGAA
jgi:hypothetical protein